MHIVMLSDFESLGGAAVSTSRLAEALAQRHRVTRLVLVPDGRRHPWRTIALGRPSFFERWIGRIGRRFSPERFPHPGGPAHVERELRRWLGRLRPDVVNLHNLHGGAARGWTPRLAEVAAEFAPVVWTLHDMWSFTGRCAYSYDCSAFRGGCNASCPTSGEHPALAPSNIAPAWQDRQRVFHDHPELVAVTPSHWLADQARHGLWRAHRIEVIPYSLDLSVFRPLDRVHARRILGIPVHDPVVLLAAFDLSERRKGAMMFPDVWTHVVTRPITVLTMGHGQVPVSDPRIHVRDLGFVSDDAVKALAYSAADVFLHPAPVDNLPNALLESLACGTPAVGFAVGGVPELIRPDCTGWLAPEGSSAALGRTLEAALAQLGERWRDTCRTFAEENFARIVQAERYELLFTDLVGRPNPVGNAVLTTSAG